MRKQKCPVFRDAFHRAIVISCIAFIAMGASIARGADEGVPSNFDLLTRLSTTVAEDIIESIESDLAGRGVRLRPLANTEQYKLLENVFTKLLASKDVRIFKQQQAQAGAPAEPDAPLVLEYETLEFELEYSKVYRSHLIGGKRVKRRANVKVLAKLVSTGSDEVEWIGEAASRHSDQFSFGELGRIEAGTYQIARPAIPATGWGKLVEPVFVSGIIVGMIYLFFSNQSDE